MASSLGISSWTPLKPQHSIPNPNANPFANQLWYIDFLTPPKPLIISHRLPAFLESLMPLKNWCSIHARCSKTVWSIPYVSLVFFPSLKHNFITYPSSNVSDCIFEIHQQWQSDFSKEYSNSCCSCWFEPEIIKIGQSSHKMYSNKIQNSQESTRILNAFTKKVLKLIELNHEYTYIQTLTAYIFISLIWRLLPDKTLVTTSQLIAYIFLRIYIYIYIYISNSWNSYLVSSYKPFISGFMKIYYNVMNTRKNKSRSILAMRQKTKNVLKYHEVQLGWSGSLIIMFQSRKFGLRRSQHLIDEDFGADRNCVVYSSAKCMQDHSNDTIKTSDTVL